jgi:hypothetical protein
MLLRHHPPQMASGGSRGGEIPTPASKRGGSVAAVRLATYPCRSRRPVLAGNSGWCGAREFCGARRPRRWSICRAAYGRLVSGQHEIQLPEFGFMGVRQRSRWNSTLEAAVDRSLGRRGRSLVVAAALLGALIGTGLGLAAEDTQTSPTVAAPDPADGAALAASPPGSQPPASRAAASGHRSDANPSSGTQQAESADRSGKRDATAHRHREADRHKSGNRGKDKPGKGKNN